LFARLGALRPTARPTFSTTFSANTTTSNDDLLLASLASAVGSTAAHAVSPLGDNNNGFNETIDEILAEAATLSELFGSF
jgi:hypothetical protein